MATRGALFAVRGESSRAAPRSALTLPELAAALIATGIVTVLGYSAYRTQQVRNEVAQGIAAASELIPAIAEHFGRHGDVPAASDVHRTGVAPPMSPVIDSVTLVDGRIDVVFGQQADAAIAGRRISLTPYETVDRHIVWVCGNRKPGPGLEPLGFATGGRMARPLVTTIEPQYLSPSCR